MERRTDLLISIHAPLTGSDGAQINPTSRKKISIHAPLTGSDLEPEESAPTWKKFQSTLPLRGATRATES